jgi:hypothetical protein
VASTLNAFRREAVGFIDWLDSLLKISSILRLRLRSNALNLLGLAQRGAILANSKEQSSQHICATEPAIESWPAKQRDNASDREGHLVAGTVAERPNEQQCYDRGSERDA